MEKRAVLAAILMAVLLMVYQAYFVPAPERPPAPEQPASPPGQSAPSPLGAPATPGGPAQAPAKPSIAQAPAPAPSTKAELAAPPAAPRPPQHTATVDAGLYRAVVSSEGGKFQEFTLRYRGEKPIVAVGDLGPDGLLIGADGSTGEPVPMHVRPDTLVVSEANPTGELSLNGERDGLRVKETLRFHAGRYAIDVLIRLENATSTPRTVNVALPWFARRYEKAPDEKFTGQRPTEVVWSTGGSVSRIEDLGEVAPQELNGEWVGLGSTWYLAALVPKTPGFKLVTSGEPRKNVTNGTVSVAVRATPTIAPGQTWEGHVVLYVGPKEYDRLADHGLEGTLNFGGFPVPKQWGGLPMEWLGVPILRLMNWVYRYVGNYGIAIILLTVVSKILFYPLTVKSMKSMKAMQALQPQVNALRSKYKSDARKLQEETMALYRKHKVNPMGGCLPMLAQIPIFYALYLALSVSVELQNAAFLCFGRLFGVDVWICDLASQDPTYVLPILMGVTMFIQQKMTPTMGDPRQAKMMLIMPFIFTFMFLNLPSGLVLYWTVSNVLQILQQWYMDRPRQRGTAREAKDAARA